MRMRAWMCLLAVGLFAWSCGSSVNSGNDAGIDAGHDAGPGGDDEVVDAGEDAGGGDVAQDAGGGDVAQDAGGADVAQDAGAGDAGEDGGGGGDSGLDAGGDLGADGGDAGGDFPPLSRAWQWIRTNPMFISGLTVSAGTPPAQFVNEYFDDFGANAVHLWQDGLPTEMDAWAAVGNPAFRWVSWTLPGGGSGDGGQLAGGYPPNSPGRIGYQISDEPRTWEELMDMQVGLAALRAHDPDALLILNFMFGNDDLEEMLDTYATQFEGDIISYDNYVRSNNSYTRMAIYRDAGLRHGMPYWRYMDTYMDEDFENEHDESDLRWDAFSGLVMGFTGHTWFIYQIDENHSVYPVLFEHQNDFAAAKTERWHIAAQINREMANLGRAITQLISTDVRYVPTVDLYLPQGILKWEPGAGGDPYLVACEREESDWGFEILVGFFRDDAGEIYVMVQNVSHEHGDFPTNNSDAGVVHLAFDFSDAPAGFDPTSVLNLNKLNGQVETVSLSPEQDGQRTLDITLAAGDPFLFKYNTGTTFALGL
ncbi:MAG: hypothetical protein JRF33_26815 [Deltaproteobacteria bacterium]|nr:hypothetical protein [Deltaproteobacteria bacterium]